MEGKEKKRRLPNWIRIKFSSEGQKEAVANELSSKGLYTVCQGAKCPNLCECWNRGTATFMILGKYCTRNCRFCAVEHKENPPEPDPEEPIKLAIAVEKFKLKHVVVTSVTRDDLEDYGAGQFCAVASEIRKLLQNIVIEFLVPDFMGRKELIRRVVESGIDIFNHNVETVRRLTPLIRDKAADYDRSLAVLRTASELAKGKIRIKSGIMLGLGETDDEIAETICEIRKTGTEMLTIGQYIRPTTQNIPEKKFLTPDEFEHWKFFAMELGFKSVWSAPLVRSSYMAEEQNCKLH